MRLLATVSVLTLPVAALGLATLAELAADPPRSRAVAMAAIQPNNNQRAAGRMRGNVLELALVADTGRWRPADDRPAVTVAALREEGRPLQNPGPMIRVRAGTQIAVTFRNALTRPLFVFGLHERPAARDAGVRVEPGETREFRFSSGEPGTYLYFARTDSTLRHTVGTDGQLNGALIVERPGYRQPRGERVFVISIFELDRDTSAADSIYRVGAWYPAINGRSWPHTERLTATTGQRVFWRWINASDRVHPMHLHGFYFAVESKGSWTGDTIHADKQRPLAVTELMRPASTFTMSWTPERPGNWLMHCHMLPHIMPFSVVPDAPRPEPHHDADHIAKAMAGLVLGITVTPGDAWSPSRDEYVLRRQLRLIAQHGTNPDGTPAVSYILQRGVEPAPDSVAIPGSPIVLRRGEPVEITIVNRLKQATSIHWHGLELESFYDGVAGWSGMDRSVAPLIAAGDSFIVRLTPPRSGSFMYHTHMDELEQLTHGAYGPLLVLDPHERYDPVTDRTVIVSSFGQQGGGRDLIDGSATPDTLHLRAGTTYRLRLMNVGFAKPMHLRLRRDTTFERWTPIAKDGADLDASRRVGRPASLIFGVGEIYDFSYTPTAPGDLTLDIRPLRETTPTATRVVRVTP